MLRTPGASSSVQVQQCRAMQARWQMVPRMGMSSIPLLTRIALVPAARASLPPRPRASSTLWICRASHAADLTTLCVNHAVSSSLSGSHPPRAHTSSRWGCHEPAVGGQQEEAGRACWPSGMSRSGSELPGRMGAAGPACTASPTPRCCGASMYANPRLSPPVPVGTASVTPAE